MRKTYVKVVIVVLMYLIGYYNGYKAHDQWVDLISRFEVKK